jgi:hypothetical protein
MRSLLHAHCSLFENASIEEGGSYISEGEHRRPGQTYRPVHADVVRIRQNAACLTTSPSEISKSSWGGVRPSTAVADISSPALSPFLFTWICFPWSFLRCLYPQEKGFLIRLWVRCARLRSISGRIQLKSTDVGSRCIWDI